MAINTSPFGFKDGAVHPNGLSTLEAPDDISLCFAISDLAQATLAPGCAAALGKCWHGAGNLTKVKCDRAEFAQYGVDCENELYRLGFTRTEIIQGGTTAVVLCQKAVPKSALVTEHEKNSEAGPENPAST